ncbi:MAG: 50S ribosomal protein L18 [Rhodobacter sp.]|nr:50S ribosomal protein L18 [Rhodobacter sp.]MCY4167012.1 50S ribosomal protein L18 [Rhodobacter sp.]MCY4242987.1 50S ribosomal protein L18 [Rhodobacter sp.]
MADSKRDLFIKRRRRVRNRLRKVGAGRVRLCVHRSNRNISAQLIDDSRGVTLASASSLEKALELKNGSGVEAAAIVGAALAERAAAAGVRDACFDRGGYLFHGRVKALAEAVRAGGLNV